MKRIILLLVAVAVVAMAYFTAMTIITPVQFDKEMASREQILQRQLKTIAKVEKAYEELYDRYASREELVDFLQNGKVYYVNAEGEYTDAMREQGLSEREAAAKGLIKRDTVWKPAKGELLEPEQNIEDLFKVLKTGNAVNIATGTIQQIVGQDTIQVPVFEATIKYTDYLGDLDATRLKEKEDEAKAKAKGFPGLRIGSLNEVKTNGNWE